MTLVDEFFSYSPARANPSKQSGQSVAEFVISIGVLSSLLLAIPLIGKLGFVKLNAQQAANYAAWRVNQGVGGDDGQLSNEIGQRFFSHTGADVLTGRNAECQDQADTDAAGNSMVAWRDVKATVLNPGEGAYGKFGTNSPQPMTGSVTASSVAPDKAPQIRFQAGGRGGDALGGFGKAFSLSSNSQRTVRVSVPVSMVTGMRLPLQTNPDGSEPTAMMITTEMGTLGDSWQASNTAAVKETLKHSIPLKPYEEVQVKVLKAFNSIVRATSLDHTAATEDIYQPEVIPADRWAKVSPQ